MKLVLDITFTRYDIEYGRILRLIEDEAQRAYRRETGSRRFAYLHACRPIVGRGGLSGYREYAGSLVGRRTKTDDYPVLATVLATARLAPLERQK